MPLAAYLTGAVGSTFLISAPQAEAAVTSVTFGFGSVFSDADGIGQFQTTPAFGSLYGYNGGGGGVLNLEENLISLWVRSIIRPKLMPGSTL